MFCPNCGENLEDNAVFCSKCGMRLHPETVKEALKEKEPETVKAVKVRKNRISFKAIIAMVLVAVIAVGGCVGIGLKVSSEKPINIAKSYIKEYYAGNIKKADKKCLVTMADQWQLSADKYHDGDLKSYFTSNYGKKVTTAAGAYKALGESTKLRFENYYGQDFSFTIKNTSEKELDDDNKNLLILAVKQSEFSDSVANADLITDVKQFEISYIIDGDLEGTDGTLTLTLMEYNGDWKVLNPLVFGWS
jgi:hypothetical protein